MASSVIDSAMVLGGKHPTVDFESLETMGYSLFAFYILVPLLQLIKAKLTKDPIVEGIKSLNEALTLANQKAETSQTNILISLEGIHEHQIRMIQKVTESTQYGLSDESLSINYFHDSIDFCMLKMISTYHERIRKNNIKERALVLGRYHRSGQRVSGDLYVTLNRQTCSVNGRRLSGFLNGQGADALFARVAEELFNNHVKKATDGDAELNEEDIESALERFTSVVLGAAKKWIKNDKLTLDRQWEYIEGRIKFIVESEDIDYL